MRIRTQSTASRFRRTITWVSFAFGVLGLGAAALSISYFRNHPDVVAQKATTVMVVTSAAIGIGCGAYCIGALVSFLTGTTPRSMWLRVLFAPVSLVILFLFLPIALPFLYVTRVGFGSGKRASRWQKILLLIFLEAVCLVVWTRGVTSLYDTVKYAFNFVNDRIAISGTGSMYPSFPKGHGKTLEELSREVVSTQGMMRYPTGFEFGGKRYFNYILGRGDIVSFINDKTRSITQEDIGTPTGFLKRTIALPGDTVEVRDGILFINNEPQREPYTARGRSTFGGSVLSDCTPLTVPDGKLFVMGDNRKGSLDSRHELGLVDFRDIDHVLPYQKQIGTLSNVWHDATNDLDPSQKISLDVEAYIDLLNAKRKEAGKAPFRLEVKLVVSAKKRGETMLKYDDFSFEATRSGFTQARAMEGSGYSNIVWGETYASGHYEAEELIDNQFAFPQSKAFLLNGQFQDIGIAEVDGVRHGCPTKIIVQHLAGYVPPNYTKEQIASWKSALGALGDVETGWNQLKSFQPFYEGNKDDVDRINDIIRTRISRIAQIVTRMEANGWLSREEQEWASQDVSLGNEFASIANRLNDRLSHR